MPNLLRIAPSLILAVGVASAHSGPSAAQTFNGQILFSDKELPAAHGSSADYIAKLKADSKSAFKYGSDHKFRLHYASFAKNVYPSRHVIIEFVRVTSRTERDEWSTSQVMGYGSEPYRGSFEVSSSHVPVGHYKVEATYGPTVLAEGSIDIDN